MTAICGLTLPFLGGDQPFLGTPAFAQEGTTPLKENSPHNIDDHHPQTTFTVHKGLSSTLKPL